MIGTRLAHYEITGHLGSGGMGEVYQAADSKLGRRVAIKLLPAVFASDTERLLRFRREAQVLASLNHPNIAQIYGIEESGESRCIVMELVEGETLESLIKKGPIPVEDALKIAKQIAGALEAAHEKGIVHRDLKPGNVMLARDGSIKVLDFGLAKTSDSDSPSASPANSPTLMTGVAATNQNVILGTAAYMSPEQARGKSVDRRADIWAFGAVLFEMLTGGRAFPGEDLTETLAAVVKMEPDWSALAPDVSSVLRQVLQLCLRKDPQQRIQAIGDVRLALDGAFETAVAPSALSKAPSTGRGGRIAWIGFALAALAAAGLAIPALRHWRETAASEMRTEIVTPATDNPASFALSPDGQSIVFAAADTAGSRLWLRSLGATSAQPLAGTEGGTSPFWSPDSRSIAFFAGSALKRLDIGGGASQILAPALAGSGGTWNAEGVIIFAPSVTSPLMRVPATGGVPVAVTTLSAQQSGHVSPWFLPGGRLFLFSVRGLPEVAGIYIGDLDGTAPTRLVEAAGSSLYLPAGWLLWVRDRALLAQRLDTGRKTLAGEPLTLADNVTDDGRNRGGISASVTGLVAYRTGESGRRQLTWFDRLGAELGTVGEADDSTLNPSLSPDGRRAVVSRTVQGNTDIWLVDSARMTRVSFDRATDMYPVWSPDGARLAFRSTRNGVGDLFERLVSGGDAEQLLETSDQLKTPSSFSPDGRYLLYMSQDPQTGSDLWIRPITGANSKPWVFLKTPFREAYGVFSPDGRWVAYQSNESGRTEIYVRPFVSPDAPSTGAGRGGQWQASTSGGISPVWSHNGRELYYLDPSGALTAVPIAVKGGVVEPGAPVKLFATHAFGGGIDAQQGRQFDVAPDGRFLINTVLTNAAPPITLLQNWKAATK
jgi:Tol biopolymer transport system component